MEIGYRIVTLLLLTAALGISIHYRHRAEKEGGRLDTSGGSRLLIVMRLAGLAAFVPLILYLINPAWVAWARFPAPDWLRWLAMGVAAAMIPFIYWLFDTLGNNISPRETTREGHELIVAGPYRYIRHPLYTFGGIFFTALSLGVTMWWTLLLLGVGFVLLLIRTPREEENLVALFGDQYTEYMKGTGRYFPRIHSSAQP